jgi:hypothetical protein
MYGLTLYVIEHELTGRMVSKECTGSDNIIDTVSVEAAATFDTRGEARDYAQNFGPEWKVTEY